MQSSSSCRQSNHSSIGTDSIVPVEVVTDLNRPWGIAFLDAETMLITERNGSLQHVKNTNKKVIQLPINIHAEG